MLTLRLKTDPMGTQARRNVATLRMWIRADCYATADSPTIFRLWHGYCCECYDESWREPSIHSDRLRFAIFCREEGVIE